MRALPGLYRARLVLYKKSEEVKLGVMEEHTNRRAEIGPSDSRFDNLAA
jgi:hypothetical protein